MKKPPKPVDIEVGKKIKALRNLRGMTQTALGEHLGITFQQVQKYEKGTNRVSASALVEIARALDVRPAALLPDEEAPPLDKQARALAAASQGAEAIAGLLRYAREGDGSNGVFEDDIFEQLLDAAKMAMEVEGAGGAERHEVYAAICTHLEGWA